MVSESHRILQGQATRDDSLRSLIPAITGLVVKELTSGTQGVLFSRSSELESMIRGEGPDAQRFLKNGGQFADDR